MRETTVNDVGNKQVNESKMQISVSPGFCHMVHASIDHLLVNGRSPQGFHGQGKVGGKQFFQRQGKVRQELCTKSGKFVIFPQSL